MKVLLFVLACAFLISCYKKKEDCGKITNVTFFDASTVRKDTIRVSLLVQFSTNDSRDFSFFRNKKNHNLDFWYSFIGTQFCIGDNLPD